jgi:hypothetical protein
MAKITAARTPNPGQFAGVFLAMCGNFHRYKLPREVIFLGARLTV